MYGAILNQHTTQRSRKLFYYLVLIKIELLKNL